jgi:hypothetical protein
MTTTNLADFGYRELSMAGTLLTAYAENPSVCPYFTNEGVQLMLNQNSGNVFLTDSDYNVLMMNGDKLEGFYSSPYEGKEGFYSDLVLIYADMHPEDKEWFEQLEENLGHTLKVN